MAALTARTDKQNEERVTDIAGLRTRLATDSAYMEALASKTMGVFFSAYRSDHDIISCFPLGLRICIYVYETRQYKEMMMMPMGRNSLEGFLSLVLSALPNFLLVTQDWRLQRGRRESDLQWGVLQLRQWA